MTDSGAEGDSGTPRRQERTLLEKIKCGVGLHDYGEPQVMKTALIIQGEQTDRGYDLDVDESPDRERWVEQHCLRKGCWGSRKRPDLDVEEVSRLDG